MASLTSSWHSSSLTFVTSSQNAVRPSTTTPTITLRGFCTKSRRLKMAKIVSLLLLVLFVAVAIGFVVSDTGSEVQEGGSGSGGGNGSGSRSRHLRAKSLSLKRRKINAARLRTEEPTVLSDTETATGVSPTEGERLAGEGEGLASSTTTTTRPKSKKSSRSNAGSRSERPPRESSAPIPEGCGECDQTSCKNVAESSCQTGLVMDRCSCCLICGTGEGNRCYNASIPNLSYNSDVGTCGTGLACILRKDLDPSEPREALCECRDRRLVCGNDNQTYNSECKLRETAHSNSGLAIASWGPCVTAPWMPSAVENITVAEGEDASLSCEVKGFPSAIIHWEFLSTLSNVAPTILPGDDSSVVVTVRGGPEQTMSTSWIQIISVTNERQGIYYCVARNSEGVARSLATVTISKAIEGRSQVPREN